jgi:aryl-alcohol dehydrogenase-like predicted oxidoreductase
MIKSKISRITFGCEPLGGTDWGNFDLNEVHKAIKRAVERGINSFDVADVYGLGKAEIELSKALGSYRKEAFIISKFGVRWDQSTEGGRAKTYLDSSPNYLFKALENSLKRLKIDAIPLYLVHWPDENTKIEDTLMALEKVKKEGKIIQFGISNFFSQSLYKRFTDFNISAIQVPLNLIDFKRSENVFKEAKNQNVSTLSYGPLAQGLLSGKYNLMTNFDKSDRRSRLAHFQSCQWPNNLKIIQTLDNLSDKYDKSISQIAIRWVIDNFNIDSVIVGAKNVNQIESNIDTLNFKLEKDDIDFLNKIVGYA